jgi:phosphatidylglycerophosphate synthase
VNGIAGPDGLVPELGLDGVLMPGAATPELVAELERLAPGHVPPGMIFRVASREGVEGHTSSPVIEQQADTIVDSRLLAQVARLAAASPQGVVCVDDCERAASPKAKSPYAVGVPGADEARPVAATAVATLAPIGLVVRGAAPGTPVILDVGRYYWHTLRTPADIRAATTKILLSTMKSTDGFFARTNRRVSLRISRLLLHTPVTANLVTIGTLGWGLAAGWLYSIALYPTFVAGSLFAWFASMLDGVDGELARARFETSSFGHWLEMVCDYVFYIALCLGLGAGVRRMRGGEIWLVVGLVASAGVVVSFMMVAGLKRAYARQGAMGDFYLAYQRTASAPGSNLLLRLTPYLMALMTRAGFPYLLVASSLFLNKPTALLVTICITTNGFWMVALYVSRLRVTLHPRPAVRPSSIHMQPETSEPTRHLLRPSS